MKKIVFLLTHCRKSGPVQQMLNIIKYLDRNYFEPYLITLYPEDKEGSQLDKYLHYTKHLYVPTSKLDMITGRDKHLRIALEKINPDVIHSLGVFPDFAVSRMKQWKQVITLRNYVYEDYPSKFGKLQGYLLAKIHIYAMKHTAKTVTCSESLANIYKENLGLQYNFIRNGVDVEQFSMTTKQEKIDIRKKLNLPQDAFIFAYTGQIIERKNVGFLLDTFSKHFMSREVYLLLLGDGALLNAYKKLYGDIANVDFRGSVTNVNYYLKACDAYVSTSTSEGLPNGVLEAMATGLPVVLSDIQQHLEIWNVNIKIGYCYKQGIENDLAEKMALLINQTNYLGKEAYVCAHDYFSAKFMSLNYQELYSNL